MPEIQGFYKVLTTVADGDITPDVILKSSYVVDFLGLKRGFLLSGPIAKVTINFLPKNNHTFHRKFFQLFPELIIFASDNT